MRPPTLPPATMNAAITKAQRVMTAWMRDLGVEVLDQRADRHVHHGRVEHHYELGGGQDDQCLPLGHSVSPLVHLR
jgi:hypothetical protein